MVHFTHLVSSHSHNDNSSCALLAVDAVTYGQGWGSSSRLITKKKTFCDLKEIIIEYNKWKLIFHMCKRPLGHHHLLPQKLLFSFQLKESTCLCHMITTLISTSCLRGSVHWVRGETCRTLKFYGSAVIARHSVVRSLIYIKTGSAE